MAGNTLWCRCTSSPRKYRTDRATFENSYNPARCDIIGCIDHFGAQIPEVKPNAQSAAGYQPCLKSPALDALIKKANLDPAFVNYCLKGSQTDFIDNTGLDVRLGNSVTENGFVKINPPA